MQASLIDFDDLLDAPAADAAQVTAAVSGTHQLQQEGGSPAAAADALDLWPSTASALFVEPRPASSSDPFIDFMSSGLTEQQESQQAGQQHAGNEQQQQQQQQQVMTVQEHAVQGSSLPEQQQQIDEQQHSKNEQDIQAAAGDPQFQQHQPACQQHSNPQSCSSIDPSLLPVCERVVCLGQLLQQHGAAQGEANASIR
jgi:hypothetical protein